MLKQPLFFHQQTPNGKSLGFSAMMVQDQTNPLMAKIAITFCNKKDKSFNKKVAREVLRSRALEDVPVKDIPVCLARAKRHCYRNTQEVSNATTMVYTNILRKFL